MAVFVHFAEISQIMRFIILLTQIGIDSINEYPMSSYGYDDLFGKRVKGWVHDPNNITTGGWGLTLTVREMARFGQLYLNNGFWNGKQIIPQDWIAKSTAPNLNHYGYMWWLFENHGLDAFAAMGDGGNTICCVPQKKFADELRRIAEYIEINTTQNPAVAG